MKSKFKQSLCITLILFTISFVLSPFSQITYGAEEDFMGNIEGRDIMEGNCDVMVCDGFVGNVVLKTVEGMGHVISKKVKGIFKKNLITKIGALFVMSGLNDFKKSMDYREYGGAPLLGCKKPVIKGHGSSDAKAIFAAIKQAKRFISTDVISNIEERLKKINTEEIENA